MAKVFIDIKQTFHKRAIIDVNPSDTEADILNKIQTYAARNGGTATVIDQGGEITFEHIMNEAPTKADEQTYECID